MQNDIEFEKEKVTHLGKNTQRIREMIGMKQSVLATKTKLSQQYISKLEQSDSFPDDILEKIASGLGVTTDLIKNFSEEKAIYNIQTNFTYHTGSSNANLNWQPHIVNNPIDKVAELFEKLLQSEKEKVELLTNANNAILELSQQIKGIRR